MDEQTPSGQQGKLAWPKRAVATQRELAWLKRLERVLAAQPPNTWVFVAMDSTVNLYLVRLGPGGHKITGGEGGRWGFDAAWAVGAVKTRNWDGGEW